jgi:hypothetical protein
LYGAQRDGTSENTQQQKQQQQKQKQQQQQQRERILCPMLPHTSNSSVLFEGFQAANLTFLLILDFPASAQNV